ncbi:porin family protein [Salinimicrobium sp. GXAS 041]|uniref:porin family protein n=1 Tax=Salinimicrobium sp. GXAS 041 TaxID=3400806 RepID=UPI003C74A83C
MPRVYFIIILLFFSGTFLSAAQEVELGTVPEVDSLYREDQFYLGFTYNILAGSENDISQSGFSGGFKIGFIRDWPLNQQRNVAIGTGLGWALDTYGQNLFIGEGPGSEETVFEVMDEDVIDYDKNRFATQSLELPLQFRWRTSNALSHKFWRVYTGMRLGYIYYFHSSFEQPGNSVNQVDVPELDRLRLGATFTFGYNTFNFHFYYSLNSFFSDAAQIDGETFDLRTFQVGLMFYIL